MISRLVCHLFGTQELTDRSALRHPLQLMFQAPHDALEINAHDEVPLVFVLLRDAFDAY
jgi:hypothetical protein